MEYSFPIVFDECLWGPHTFWSKHWKKFFSKVALKKKRNFVLGTQNNRKIWQDTNILTKLKSKYFIHFFRSKNGHISDMKWFKKGKKNTIMLFIVEKWNILLWTFHFKISWIHFRPSDWLKWSFFKTIVSLSGKSTNQFHWVIPLIQKMRLKNASLSSSLCVNLQTVITVRVAKDAFLTLNDILSWFLKRSKLNCIEIWNSAFFY